MDPKMKVALILFVAFASTQLSAQRTDTTEIKNGVYGVFEADKKGRPKSLAAVYNTTGLLIRHEHYRAGLLHGPVIYFDTLGRKTLQSEYRKGHKHGSDIYYFPEGRVHYQVPFRNGKMHGDMQSFHPNGNIEWTGAFRNGTFFGKRILRDSTGALFNGEYTTFYPMGRGHFTVICINGRPQGEIIVLGPNDKMTFSGNYTNGFPDGEFLFFDRAGTVWRKEYYIMGKFERSTQRGNKGGSSPDQNP